MAIYINRNAPESGIASLLAMQGNRGDTELVHMTKPEVNMLRGTGRMSMNRETGLPQFARGSNILTSIIQALQRGGLIGLATGGNAAFEGQIPGPGHGMQDNVHMPIMHRKGGIAAVSPDEYVVPSDVMAMIGNGSADAGAGAMDDFIAKFRIAKYGRPTQPPEIDPRTALQSLMG
tara:strand:- start:1114 stop:1641 length:528 start_codon:yes stop_codon:yes gene_type:complete